MCVIIVKMIYKKDGGVGHGTHLINNVVLGCDPILIIKNK